MKYIRTKDELGVYIEYDGEYKDLNKGTYFKTWRGVYIHEDWKLADTIEELCDEFVVVHNTYFDNGKDIYYQAGSTACHRGDSYYNFTFEQIRTGKREIGGTLYGAIWTDKGLIYVAKMNEKGELELI